MVCKYKRETQIEVVGVQEAEGLIWNWERKTCREEWRTLRVEDLSNVYSVRYRYGGERDGIRRTENVAYMREMEYA